MGYYLDGQPLQPHTLIMPTVGACQDLHGQTAAVYSLTLRSWHRLSWSSVNRVLMEILSDKIRLT